MLHPALLLALVAAPAPAPGAGPAADAPRVVEVSGEGKVEVAPDVADVTLGAHALENEVGRAKQQVDAAMARLLEVVRALGVADEDVRTTDILVAPHWVPESGRAQGYDVTRRAAVTLHEVGKLGALLDRAVAAGANADFAVALRASREAELRDEALRRASADARRKAELLAAAFGARLGRVRSVKEGSAGFPIPLQTYYTHDAALAAGRPGAAETTLPGRIEVRAAVTAAFELE